MKLSKKYLERVQDYREWARCSTPLADLERAAIATHLPDHIAQGGDTSAAEWLFTFETHGQTLPSCAELGELKLLWRGKAMRDWWTKEARFWKKEAVAYPEEFLVFLMPVCFIDLFGRAPIAELVRYYHDNRYGHRDFAMDMRLKRFVEKHNMIYFERDDRMHWTSAWTRILRLKFVDPWKYRLKRSILGRLGVAV